MEECSRRGCSGGVHGFLNTGCSGCSRGCSRSGVFILAGLTLGIEIHTKTKPLNVQQPGFFSFTSSLLTYGINLSRIVNDICQKGDVYAKASQMPQDRTASGLP